jgi:hypothetical protein
MSTVGGPGERRYWLDERTNVERLVRGFYALCLMVLLLDLFVPRHGAFAIEQLFGFYAFFGFIACVTLVLVAKQLRRVLMRAEDYYDR